MPTTVFMDASVNSLLVGRCRSDKERHSIDRRWWLQYGGIRSVHTSKDSRADQRYLRTESHEDTDRRKVVTCRKSLP